ncbi:MAG: protein translocase subunit SecD [Candidatus Nealsonbacteria bacterium]|nr:protein translocase subunit SecD [Candidatus Nealsonbacteria bacterium]
MKRKTNLILILILAGALLAGIFDYPKYFNQGVDFFNHKFSFSFPHFPDKPFKLGLDLQGGIHLVYEADLSGIEQRDFDSVMEGLRDVIERRVNLFGVVEPLVQTEKAGNYYRLIIELAGIKDVNEAIKMVGETPFLEFKEVKSDYEKIVENNQKIQGGTATGTMEDPFQSTLLTGKYLKGARVEFSQVTGEAGVALQFDEEGAKVFTDLTEKNVGKPLAIFIDGILLSAPKVNEKISGGRAQITGKFTVQEAKDLAQNLSAGALPVHIKLISQQVVGPTLGSVSLEKSLKAGILSFLIIIAFMILIYRLPGFLSSISLLIYVILVLAVFKAVPITLTLAGIAGFILSIGMAIDANILIFARMREERKEQKSFETVVENGFNRAFSSIRDSNLTTIVVALILFGLGTGFVKGYAFALFIGVSISFFTAIVITKNLIKVFVGTKFEKWEKLWR